MIHGYALRSMQMTLSLVGSFSSTITMKNSRILRQSAKEFLDKYNKFTVTTYARPELVLTRGEGSHLWDSTGKKYIDFFAGISVTGLGHSHPGVAEILADQGKTLIHASNLYYNNWTPKLGKELVEKTIASGAMQDASRVFLCNSGSEANEAALKFARKWGNSQSSSKTKVVSFEKSFHGRTYGSLSATANEKYQKPFWPMVPGFQVGKINEIDALPSLVDENTCAVILEPIQGEGGINVVTPEFAKALRDRCTQVGAILIYDEIQSGLSRTGEFWSHAAFGPEGHPDIITMAKALGNGFPIGATMISEQVESILKVGDHGTTYGGNPLGARIGCFVLDELTKPELLQGVSAKSAIFLEKFAQLQNKYPEYVLEARGRGLLLGLQLAKDPSALVEECKNNGLFVITCGTNTLRFVPALNIEDSVIREGLDILEHAIERTA